MVMTIEEYEKSATALEKNLIDACRAEKAWGMFPGEVPLQGADDAPTVRAGLIRLLAEEKTSLHDKGISLKGVVILGKLDLSFATCRGRLILDNCRIEGKLDLSNAEIDEISLQGSHFKEIFAKGVRVKGSVFLRRAVAQGTVNFNGAQIGGELSLQGAHLKGAFYPKANQNVALIAQQAVIGQSLNLSNWKAPEGQSDRPFTADGMTNLAGAQIGGQVVCEGATLDGGGGVALYAQSLRLHGEFCFRNVKNVIGGVDLTSAQVRDLVDDAGSWDKCKDVILDGFAYDRITGDSAPKTFAARKAWLEKGARVNGEFRPQPYTQFAKVIRAAGHEAEARKALAERDTILFQVAEKADRDAYEKAKNGDLTQGDMGKIWLRLQARRIWAWLSRKIIGHGHKPHFALLWLAGLWLIGTVVYFIAYRAGLMVPNSDVILVSDEWLRAVEEARLSPTGVWTGEGVLASVHYESFFAAIYALDLFLPIVDLGQESAWAVTTPVDFGWGWCLRVATFLYQVMGWLVTSLGIAAVTGFVQRDKPE